VESSLQHNYLAGAVIC